MRDVDLVVDSVHSRSMQWVSVISREMEGADAVEDVIAQLRERLDAPPELLVVFSSRHHARQSRIAPSLHEAFEGAMLVGCSAYSVIGDAEEEELEPALSVTAAVLPDVVVDVTHVDAAGSRDWIDDVSGDGAKAMMLIVDAFSTDAEDLIRRLDERFEAVPKFGGFASGGVYPGSNSLYHDDRTLQQGSLVVTFSGDIAVDTIVAQGCRPVGDPAVVKRHRGNLILELDRGRPTDVLQQVYESLPAEDRALIPDSLHVGLELVERPDGEHRRGDFLVRPLAGIDSNSGAITIGGRVTDDQVVQFHLRDARASTEDLEEHMQHYIAGETRPVAGALLFSCVARGVDLFGSPNHDTALFAKYLGDVPVGGFFCSREIGPVSEQTYIHGYTSTFVMFRPESV